MTPRESILIDCEGVGCLPCAGGLVSGALGMCAMCGLLFPVDDDLLVVSHERQDVLAMLDRGDFG